MVHDKSQDRDNFKWKLGFTHYRTFIHSTAEEKKKQVNKPPRKATARSKFLTASLSMPRSIRGELTVQKSQQKKPTHFGLHLTGFLKIYINSVHTIPECHLLDQQVSDRRRAVPRNPPSSYSRRSRTCWRTRLRLRTRFGRTHLHPHHICDGHRQINCYSTGAV